MKNEIWKMTNGKSFSLPVPISRHFSWGGDEGSRTLIVRFTRPTLCYPIELHRQLKLVDWEGVKPSQEVCRTSMLSVTSPAQDWWLWVESNHQPFAYETKALPLELHSRFRTLFFELRSFVFIRINLRSPRRS